MGPKPEVKPVRAGILAADRASHPSFWEGLGLITGLRRDKKRDSTSFDTRSFFQSISCCMPGSHESIKASPGKRSFRLTMTGVPRTTGCPSLRFSGRPGAGIRILQTRSGPSGPDPCSRLGCANTWRGRISGTLIQARAALQQKRKLFILDSCFRKPELTWPAKFEKRGTIRVTRYSDIREHLSAPAPLQDR